MDNILKLLVGVLAISGLIALLVPSGSPVAPPSVASASPAAPPPPQSVPDEVFEEDAGGGGDDDELVYEEAGEEDFIMGQPSIDGKPFGGSYDPQPGNSNTAANQANDSSPGDPPPPANDGIILQ